MVVLRPLDWKSLRWLWGVASLALLLRLLLAYVLLPGSGHAGDLNWYSMWATSVSTVGPGTFYAKTVVNYPPGYIYVLWLVGMVGNLIASLTHSNVHDITLLLLKIPPILLDICSGWLLHRIALQWCGRDAESVRTAVTVAGCYLFNPAVIYDSAIWGQTDAAGAFIMILGIMSLLRWSPEISASVAVVAALIKPQFGIVLVPIVGIVLLRRYLPPFTGLDRREMQSYWLSRDGPVRLVTSSVVAIAVFYALLIPFNMDFHGFADLVSQNIEKYKYLSLNAFNPWALVTSGQTPALVWAGVDNVSSDDVPIVGSLTGETIGTALLATGFLLGIARLMWRIDWRSIVLVGAFLNMCFFILPTRVHERYLLPTFVFMSLLVVFDRRWLWTNTMLAVGSLINLHAVLSKVGTENITRLPLGEFARSPAGIALAVILQTATFLWVGRCLWPTAEIRPVVHGDPREVFNA